MKPGWHICTVCNHIYEEALEKERAGGQKTEFHDLPDSWKCPGCDAGKDMYQACSCVSMSESGATEDKPAG